MKSALENVEIRKAQLVREELEQQREQRVCVICQVAERSIVLLPCRHLCLCANCSEHDSLQVADKFFFKTSNLPANETILKRLFHIFYYNNFLKDCPLCRQAIVHKFSVFS